MTSLQILDRTTGEIIEADAADAMLAAAGIIDLSVAGLEEIAAFMDDVRALKSIATEAGNLASDEAIRRMDRLAKWTWRGSLHEVKAASPEAGTTVYDTPALRDALATLVSDGVISAEGAVAALEPIYPTAPVPYELLRRTIMLLEDLFARDEIAPHVWDNVITDLGALLLAEPDVTYKQHAAGIKALLKIPAAKGPVEACRELVDSPRRIAKVRRIA